MSLPSRLMRDLRVYTDRGWEVGMTKNQHIVLSHPKAPGKKVFGALSPSDWRGRRNLDAMVRRIEKEFGI